MKKIIAYIIVAALAVGCYSTLALLVDIVRFPECYSTTAKYQLENDIKRGNKMAIEYYQNTYVANGRELFD